MRLALFAAPLALLMLQAAAPRDTATSLTGTWSCQSLAKTATTMTFAAVPDGMSMHNAYRTADGVQGAYDETYRFDSETGKWLWSTSDSVTGSTETGMAPPWTGKTWTFNGTRHASAKHAENIQMVYTRLSADSFRRVFLTDRDGTWETTSSSVCKR